MATSIPQNVIFKDVNPEIGRQILIVDDDLQLLDLFRKMLSTPGATIFTLPSGMEVMSFLEKENVDLILLDINMPGKNGFTVLSEIRKNQKTSEIPVVLLTNNADFDSINKGMELGATDYTIKANTTPEKLRQIINKYLICFEEV